MAAEHFLKSNPRRRFHNCIFARMHYISAEGLGKSYGINPLFSNISFHINEGDKIALVARNGTGKSTLLKILAGKETPDTGKLWINKDVDVILFEQDPELDENGTIADNIFFHDHTIMNAIRNYESAVDSNNTDALSNALIEMDELCAWVFESKVKTVIS